MTRFYGYIRDRPDDRDYRFEDHFAVRAPEALPRSVDLRSTGYLADPILNQLDLGACTSHAIASALMYDQRAQGLSLHIVPSRLGIYWNERDIEGTVDSDAGAELRDGLKVVAGAPGYVDESEWPYDPSRFADAPPAIVVADEARNRATLYARVNVDATSMKQALAAGFPVIVGFSVFAAIESDQVAADGILPMPAPGEQPIGGHAVLLVGYDDSTSEWLCRNSWGDGWGQKGYFSAPYGYLDSPDFGSDFWTVTHEDEGGNPTPTPTPTPPTPAPTPAPVPPAPPAPPAPPEGLLTWLEAEAENLPEPVRDWIENVLHHIAVVGGKTGT